MDAKTAKTLADLRAALAKGKTLQEAPEKLKQPRSSLHRLAAEHELPRRRRALPVKVHTQIERDLALERSIRYIAARRKVGTGTVSRAKLRRRKRLGLPREVAPYRCNGPCGKTVIYRPCQICRAIEQAKPQPSALRPPPAGSQALSHLRVINIRSRAPA